MSDEQNKNREDKQNKDRKAEERFNELVETSAENLKDLFYSYRTKLETLARNISDDTITMKRAIEEIERCCWDFNFKDLENIADDVLAYREKAREAFNHVNKQYQELVILWGAIEAELKNFEEVRSDGK